MNTCRNNRPYGLLLTVKTFAFQKMDYDLILNNWLFSQFFYTYFILLSRKDILEIEPTCHELQ